jgi:hypothetical protein
MRKNDQTKGIFCLEGLWESDLTKKSTIQPILELLVRNVGIPFIHNVCATSTEVDFFLKKWQQKKYDAYPILYFAFHGKEAVLEIDGKLVKLDELAAKIENSCGNKIIVFGSCSTLNIDKRHLKRFLKTTGALAVCGYKIDVDWMLSTAFELLMLNEMQENEFSGRGIDSIHNKLKSLAKSFSQLDFRIVTSKDL